MKIVETESLHIAFLDDGAPDGWPAILSHGFPYDVHAFDDVVPALVAAGARVIRPWCRGFGGTRFKSSGHAKSGQQAARALDIIQLAGALGLHRPVLAGFDWGGNASCAAAALWPDRVGALVSYAGYDVIDIQQQLQAAAPCLERTCWYQHLFQSERGRRCLDENRHELCRLLWRDWSPDWVFDDELYERSAASFDNPDFVEVVIHCYRWMVSAAAGDKGLADLESKLAQRPLIKLPAVTLDGTRDPLKPGGTADHARLFTGRHSHRSVKCGHNLPQEQPAVFAQAILDVKSWLAMPNA
ncbi:alpha/beta fold hydrolase [Pantoea eucalypti]|jgi:pimeloyl-ACP methyl ester carboxylesterase|uniref:alpha/beta fold hydrolase n=1 Tax=Pantoea eucalypti TaxID=470933 RepID=UPI00289F5967|nr:alpha/beta hydrolase [Pantoea eucalypti]